MSLSYPSAFHVSTCSLLCVLKVIRGFLMAVLLEKYIDVVLL